MLRLLRGSGPRGLAVLPPSALMETAPDDARDPITLIRPLLRARRTDVAAHLVRHGVAVAHDPSNKDTRFLRVRVRDELLPLLESMSPAIAGHLCALADMLAGEQIAPDDALHDLGRAQRLAVARAKKCERPVNLRLSGGREVVVAFSEGEPVLINSGRPRGP